MEDRGALDHPFSLTATPTALSLLCTKRPLSDRRQRAERGKEGATDKLKEKKRDHCTRGMGGTKEQLKVGSLHMSLWPLNFSLWLYRLSLPFIVFSV